MGEILFTKEGLAVLKHRIQETRRSLNDLTMEKRRAGDSQDRHCDENFTCILSQEQMLRDSLGRLESLLGFYEIVVPEEQSDCVKIGTGAVVEYEDGSSYPFIFEGYLAADLLRDRLSLYSPLGQALLEAHEGEERTARLEDGRNITVKVKKILPPSRAQEVFQLAQEIAIH